MKKQKLLPGFTDNSEKWNGRIAMISFVIIIIIEILKNEPILNLIQLN
nr:Ycf17 [Porphyropsis coccinea]